MGQSQYNVVMFAYNEAQNITDSINSVFQNVNGNLNAFYIIANGCTDNTAEVATSEKVRLSFDKLHIIELKVGDKCNAWNHYVHQLADEVDTHFFVDADVVFSAGCFGKLSEKLTSSKPRTVVIAGMPLSGRNADFYRSLVTERACFFGNLYGVKNSFLQRVREQKFYLPVGLNWIDSFLTKAVNTDLQFTPYNLPDRVTWLEDVGYSFASLSLLSKSDISLYFSRIGRYELGKLQEVYLDSIPVTQWPKNMNEINLKIEKNFAQLTKGLSLFKKYLAKRRLVKLLATQKT